MPSFPTSTLYYHLICLLLAREIRHPSLHSFQIRYELRPSDQDRDVLYFAPLPPAAPCIALQESRVDIFRIQQIERSSDGNTVHASLLVKVSTAELERRARPYQVQLWILPLLWNDSQE